MITSFKAKIFKVGINPCVKVPASITAAMTATRGYIPVKGTINGYAFNQTLCPVKNDLYRLYVNGPMMKGAMVKVGDTASFTLVQNTAPETAATIPFPPSLKKALKANKLEKVFDGLIPSRQKEILRYLNSLKSDDALGRNIEKLVKGLMKDLG